MKFYLTILILFSTLFLNAASCLDEFTSAMNKADTAHQEGHLECSQFLTISPAWCHYEVSEIYSDAVDGIADGFDVCCEQYGGVGC